MPDAHLGEDCTVGTTLTISDKITPSLVGIDIGYGMLSVKLNKKEINFVKLDGVINVKVPSGFNVHEKPKKDFDFSFLRCQKLVDLQRVNLSIGSLEVENHFIEVGKSADSGEIYLIIHSGSRELGDDVIELKVS